MFAHLTSTLSLTLSLTPSKPFASMILIKNNEPNVAPNLTCRLISFLLIHFLISTSCSVVRFGGKNFSRLSLPCPTRPRFTSYLFKVKIVDLDPLERNSCRPNQTDFRVNRSKLADIQTLIFRSTGEARQSEECEHRTLQNELLRHRPDWKAKSRCSNVTSVTRATAPNPPKRASEVAANKLSHLKDGSS
jgi:hypothetical protein